MRKITLKVDENCIRFGVPRSVQCCPIALAAEQNGLKNAAVTDYSLSWMERDGPHSVYLPQEATNFVHNFDALRHVEPFEFEVEEE